MYTLVSAICISFMIYMPGAALEFLLTYGYIYIYYHTGMIHFQQSGGGIDCKRLFWQSNYVRRYADRCPESHTAWQRHQSGCAKDREQLTLLLAKTGPRSCCSLASFDYYILKAGFGTCHKILMQGQPLMGNECPCEGIKHQ